MFILRKRPIFHSIEQKYNTIVRRREWKRRGRRRRRRKKKRKQGEGEEEKKRKEEEEKEREEGIKFPDNTNIIYFVS